jgi:hypothetical protein
MDPQVALALIGAARYGMMTAFSFLEAAGKDEAEIEAFYQETKAEFNRRDPANLPDPPP